MCMCICFLTRNIAHFLIDIIFPFVSNKRSIPDIISCYAVTRKFTIDHMYVNYYAPKVFVICNSLHHSSKAVQKQIGPFLVGC